MFTDFNDCFDSGEAYGAGRAAAAAGTTAGLAAAAGTTAGRAGAAGKTAADITLGAAGTTTHKDVSERCTFIEPQSDLPVG